MVRLQQEVFQFKTDKGKGWTSIGTARTPSAAARSMDANDSIPQRFSSRKLFNISRSAEKYRVRDRHIASPSLHRLKHRGHGIPTPPDKSYICTLRCLRAPREISIHVWCRAKGYAFEMRRRTVMHYDHDWCCDGRRRVSVV